MKKLKFTSIAFLVLACVSFLQSCYPGLLPSDPYIVAESRQKQNVYHAPATQNVPLLAEKNDISLSTSLGYTSKLRGIDIQGAFIAANNFGLLAGFRNYNQKENSYEGKISSYEFGAGYVKALKGFHFEVYGGLGGGSTDNLHHTGESRIGFNNFFIQPVIAIHNAKKTIQFAFVSRISQNNFTIKDTSFNGEREPIVVSQFKIINDDPNRIFWEPGIVLRAGWKNVAFNAGVSMLKDFSQPNFSLERTNYFIGLVFRGNVSAKK